MLKAAQQSLRQLGLCALLELVLNDGSFPFRKLVLPSRTPKWHNASRWTLVVQVLVMRTFFTSDTQFDDEFAIQYFNRPFENVDEMNAVMVERE